MNNVPSPGQTPPIGRQPLRGVPSKSSQMATGQTVKKIQSSKWEEVKFWFSKRLYSIEKFFGIKNAHFEGKVNKQRLIQKSIKDLNKVVEKFNQKTDISGDIDTALNAVNKIGQNLSDVTSYFNSQTEQVRMKIGELITKANYFPSQASPKTEEKTKVNPQDRLSRVLTSGKVPPKENLKTLINMLVKKAIVDKKFYTHEGAFRIPGDYIETGRIQQTLYRLTPEKYQTTLDGEGNLDEDVLFSVIKRLVKDFYEMGGTNDELEETELPTLLRKIVDNEATTKLTESALRRSFLAIKDLEF